MTFYTVVLKLLRSNILTSVMYLIEDEDLKFEDQSTVYLVFS